MSDATSTELATPSPEHATDVATSEGARLLRLAGTLEHCAAETGISTRSLSSYRNGANPCEENARKIESALGIARATWRTPPAAFRDPSWLQEALAGLAGYPAAVNALLRHLIVRSGDTAALAELDRCDLQAARDEHYVELMRAAQEAERALASAVYGESRST